MLQNYEPYVRLSGDPIQSLEIVERCTFLQELLIVRAHKWLMHSQTGCFEFKSF